MQNLVCTRLRRIQKYSHKLSHRKATVRKREAFHTHTWHREDNIGATGGENSYGGLQRARLGQADPEKHMYSTLLS